VNPGARTNVAPEVGPPGEAVLYAFSYTVPLENDNLPPTFIIAGAGELREGNLSPDYIVRAGETGMDAVREKVKFVIGIMQSRLSGLQVKWAEVTTVDVYTVHPLHHFLAEELLIPMQEAAWHAVRWYYSRPPISGLEYEIHIPKLPPFYLGDAPIAAARLRTAFLREPFSNIAPRIPWGRKIMNKISIRPS
jgi:hypothetical protein